MVLPKSVDRIVPSPRTPKVLIISHAATVSGAPRSLRDLVFFFKGNTDWDMRVLIRKSGGSPSLFSELVSTQVFYRYCTPGQSEARSYSVSQESLRVFLSIVRRESSLRSAYKSLKKVRHLKRLPKTQQVWEQRVCREIQAWKPDVIYSNTAVNGDVIKRLDLADVPVLVHVRELATAMATLSEEQQHEFQTRPQSYLAVSESVRAYLHDEQGIPTEKVHIVPVGLDCEAIRSRAEEGASDEVRKTYLSAPESGVLIGGVGFLNARKGPDIFFEVASAVLRETGSSDEVRFIWLGEGDLLETMRARVQETGLDGKISFIGLHENPYPFIQACDFMLMTSRDDPFPRVNLEAALFGRPIVCFAGSGGSKEFACDDCGIIVPDFDVSEMIAQTIALVRDKAMREELGANAKMKVLNDYQIEKIGHKVQGILEAVLAESRE